MPHHQTITHTATKATTRIMNEYGRLRDVVVNRGGTVTDGARLNGRLQRLGAAPIAPGGDWRAERVRDQHSAFLRLLEEQGVRLHHPRDIGGAAYSIFTRDVGFVVHDVFVHSRLADTQRTWERYGLAPIVDGLKQVAEPEDGIVEGSDIVVHGQTVFVGITAHATNEQGCAALRRLLAPRGVRVVPVHCHDNVAHLDRRFAVIGPQTALIHRADLDPLDVLYLEAEFNLIDIPSDEVDTLGANVLAIAPDAVVIDARHAALRRRLRKERIEPIPVAYDEVAKMQGAFRGTTLPLARDAV